MSFPCASNTPVYEQVVERIRSAIASGHYGPGDVLPSVRGLAVELAINPNTIQRAYRELERQGLAETRRGLGVFVTTDGPRTARAQSETAVGQRFIEGIERARAAGLSAQHIRTVFYRAMSQISNGAPGSSPSE